MLRRAHTSPKLKRLKRHLGIPQCMAVGVLECLWHMAATEAPRGDIGRWSNEEIAVALEWPGEADELVDALVECRWLDRDPRHRLLVHDWSEHADRNVRRMSVVRERGFLEPVGTKMEPVGTRMAPNRSKGGQFGTRSEPVGTNPRLHARSRARGGRPEARGQRPEAREPKPSTKESGPHNSRDHEREASMVQGLLDLWQQRFPSATHVDRQRQHPWAVQIVTERSAEEIGAAVRGIGQLWPHNGKEARPWTLKDLYRKFTEAAAKAGDDADAGWLEFERGFMAATEANDA